MELEMPIASAATTTRRVSDRTARSLFRTAPAFVSSARWAVGLLALPACLALLPSAPAQAQAVVELVSNYYEAPASPTRSTSGKAAQSFTTGANADGYILTDVRLHAQNRFASVVAIREDNGGLPGNLVVRLTGSWTSGGNRTYSAPANTRLNAGTKYWVVVNDAGRDDADFWTTSSNAETGLTGFAIGDTARQGAEGRAELTEAGIAAMGRERGSGGGFGMVLDELPRCALTASQGSGNIAAHLPECEMSSPFATETRSW